MKVHNKDCRILSFEDSSLITNVSNNHSLENVLELLDSTSSSNSTRDTDTEKLSPKDFVPHCHTLVGGSSCFLFTNCKPVVLCRTSTDGVFAWRCFSCFPTLVFFLFCCVEFLLICFVFLNFVLQIVEQYNSVLCSYSWSN